MASSSIHGMISFNSLLTDCVLLVREDAAGLSTRACLLREVLSDEVVGVILFLSFLMGIARVPLFFGAKKDSCRPGTVIGETTSVAYGLSDSSDALGASKAGSLNVVFLDTLGETRSRD